MNNFIWIAIIIAFYLVCSFWFSTLLGKGIYKMNHDEDEERRD